RGASYVGLNVQKTPRLRAVRQVFVLTPARFFWTGASGRRYFLPPEISFRRSAFFFSGRTNNLCLNNDEAAEASFCWRRHSFLRTLRFRANPSPHRPTAASLTRQQPSAHPSQGKQAYTAWMQGFVVRHVYRHRHEQSPRTATCQ